MMGLDFDRATIFQYLSTLQEWNDRHDPDTSVGLPDPEKAKRAMMAAEGHC